MKTILDQKLCEKYPEIFRDRYADMTTTAMCWGFDCGEGWYEIIDDLCQEIMQVCGEVVPVATQVKEKYGTLRFYIDSGNDAVFEAISKAEERSSKTCEICGKSGVLRDKAGWYTTLCDIDANE